MQTKHTPGRLFYWPDRNGRLQVGPSTNYTVSEMCITPLEGQDANARRLVACWNACEGIDTTALEIATLTDHINRMVEAEKQRDELLAVLEAEQEWREREEAGAIDPEWNYERMVGDKRRAAIAKVRGGAA